MFVVMQAQATEEHVRAVCQKIESRGVRTFADRSRNPLDLGIVPAIRRESHLPILVDPSHGTGNRDDEPAAA
jgi:3-deoxy-D-arabino-heptulosonate 7-phosphate (DAHP) synthase